MKLPDLLPLPAVAERLHVSPRRLREQLRLRPMGRKLGRQILFTEAEVRELVAGWSGNKLPIKLPEPAIVYVERPWRHNKTHVSASGSHVYFIRSGLHVKIGWSIDIARRFADLQMANPEALELILHFAGGAVEEAKLHLLFARYRVRGEWFRFEREVVEFVERFATRIAAGQPSLMLEVA